MIINDVKRLEQENAELKAKNERLKEEKENLIEQLVIYNQFENSYNKYRTTLQEIKAIAEENQFYFGAGEIVSYETIKQLATSFVKILDLITKAEGEG